MALVYTYGTTSYTGGPTGTSWQPQNYSYGGPVTFSAAGTIDQLGAIVSSYSGTRTIKLALYDTSGNLISGTSSSNSSVATGAAAWYDGNTFTPVSVSAASYVVLSSADTANVGMMYNASNAGTYATDAYASFPSASPSGFTIGGDSGYGYGRRANFTEGASGRTATVAITTAAATVSATADVDLDADVSITTAAATVSSTATVDLDATASITAADATVSSEADVLLDATVAIDAADATVDATATLADPPRDATVAITTADATVSATAEVDLDITAAITADDATVAASATVDLDATVAITTDDATTTIATDVDLVLTSAITAEDATVDSSASIGDFITGTVDITAEDAVVSATAEVGLSGSVAVTTDDATVASAVTVDLDLQSAITAEDATVSATLVRELDATVNITTEDATVSALIGDRPSQPGAGGVIGKSTVKLFKDFLDESELRRQKRKARVEVTANDAVVRATAKVIPLEPRIAVAKQRAQDAVVISAAEANWSDVIAREDDDFDILFG